MPDRRFIQEVPTVLGTFPTEGQLIACMMDRVIEMDPVFARTFHERWVSVFRRIVTYEQLLDGEKSQRLRDAYEQVVDSAYKEYGALIYETFTNWVNEHLPDHLWFGEYPEGSGTWGYWLRNSAPKEIPQ